MDKIAVIGDYDSIYGFAALGLQTFAASADQPEESRKLLRKLAEGDFGVIYITEELAAAIPEEIERYSEVMTPAIIQIPGVRGNTGAGVRGVKHSVEQAVGSDILFGND